MDPDQHLRHYFETLSRAWGRQHWWPAESPFEVIVGAYLTQNTAWTNVEQAVTKLRSAGVLSIEPSSLAAVPDLIKLMPVMQRKRDHIQAHRRRSEIELWQWFE